MSLRIPLGGDQTTQVEFYEVERRLRRLETYVEKAKRNLTVSTLIRQTGGSTSTSGSPTDLSTINSRLDALETSVSELQDWLPVLESPPDGLASHVLHDDKTWGFPFRGLVRVATTGNQTDPPYDVVDIQGGLHLLGPLSASDVEMYGARVHGNADIHGDLTLRGDGLGFQHASIYGNTIAWSQASAVQDTWYDISDSDIADGSAGLNGITHDGNGQLTMSVAGGYLIFYDLDVEVSVANNILESGIAVNGTEAEDGRGHVDFSNVNSARSMSSVAHLTLAVGDTVNLSIRTIGAGTPTITVNNINLALVQISG